MKNFFLLIFFSIFFLSLNAQQINFEYGKLVSSFRYQNSDGVEMDNLLGSTNNHLGLGWKGELFNSYNFSYVTSLYYNKYAASGTDTLLGNYLEWQANYVGLNIGINYEFFRFSSYLNYYQNTNKDQSFAFFAELYVAAEMFVQGTQTFNKQVYNLSGVEQFDKPILFLNGGLGMMYYASSTISIFAKYTGGRSFPVFKSNSGDNEKLFFTNHIFSLGMGLNLMLVKKGGGRRG